MDIKAGVVPAYLSRPQMVAFLTLADERGISRGQLAKEALVKMLVEDGRLEGRHLANVKHKQEELKASPYPGRKAQYVVKKEPMDLLSPEAVAQARQKEALAAHLGLSIGKFLAMVKRGELDVDHELAALQEARKLAPETSDIPKARPTTEGSTHNGQQPERGKRIRRTRRARAARTAPDDER